MASAALRARARLHTQREGVDPDRHVSYELDRFRMRDDRDQLIHDHRAAFDAYRLVANAFPDTRWNDPLKPGGWSAAQVSEHLRLSFEILGGELRGRPGLRVRAKWWQRLILRSKFLGKILDHGEIPRGARAPRELSPGPGPFAKQATLDALVRVAADCEAAISERWGEPSAFTTHHVFGRLTPRQILRFSTVHLTHHAKQLTGGKPTP